MRGVLAGPAAPPPAAHPRTCDPQVERLQKSKYYAVFRRRADSPAPPPAADAAASFWECEPRPVYTWIPDESQRLAMENYGSRKRRRAEEKARAAEGGALPGVAAAAAGVAAGAGTAGEEEDAEGGGDAHDEDDDDDAEGADDP